MKLSEKIVQLRKTNNMTQEELAEICNVSRQSISKWEADIALPETEKLLLLGEIFRISMDVLLKDELTLSEVKEVHTCGNNAIQGKKKEVYEGTLIKESVTDDSIIDLLNVHKIELWNTGGKPKYWTVLFFTSDKKDFPEQIAKVMCNLTEYLTKRTFQRETIREEVGNDGKPREIKGFGEFHREKMKHL